MGAVSPEPGATPRGESRLQRWHILRAMDPEALPEAGDEHVVPLTQNTWWSAAEGGRLHP